MQIYKVNQSLEEHQSYYNLIIADWEIHQG
jgi:hypothetical protein